MAVIESCVETTPEHFENIYAEAAGVPGHIPWDRGRPHPALVNWLNAVAPSLIRCGARVAVVGCGLGHDARELMRRGYDVTAFDCSATAIEWAQRLDPAHAHSYVVADLFALPPRWRHRFDLVVEIHTVQSLRPNLRTGAVRAIGELLSLHGRLLVICRACLEPVTSAEGPPWPLTEFELRQIAALSGLVADGDISSFDDDQDPAVLRMRALFERAKAVSVQA